MAVAQMLRRIAGNPIVYTAFDPPMAENVSYRRFTAKAHLDRPR